MNQMKTKRKGEAPYTGKINTYVPPGMCVHSRFGYEDVLDPLKIYHGKDYVENTLQGIQFIGYIEDEVKQFYTTFPQKLMTQLNDELKRKHKAAGKCHTCLKEFANPDNKKVRDYVTTQVYIQVSAPHNYSNPKYWIPDHIPIAFHNLIGYNTVKN